MTFVFSKHVLEELDERKIARELVERVLQSPQQKIPEVENVTCYQVLEGIMKVKYDQEVDVLTIRFSDTPVEESDENKPGVILDYDKAGKIVGIEILNASKQIENPKSLEYAVA